MTRSRHNDRQASRRYRLGAAGILLLSWLVGGCSSGMPLFPVPSVRVIAFGDSTTAGPTPRNYWDILREKLGDPPEAFAGQGQGGETSAEGLSRLRDLIDRGIYPNAQSLLYWEGGDDIVKFVRQNDPTLQLSPDNSDYPLTDALNQQLDAVRANIEQAIQAARGAGWQVYIATYYCLEENKPCKELPFDLLPAPQAANANAYVLRLNDRIRQAASNQGAILVDVASIADTLRQDPDNYFDCNHLNEKGNTAVADIFLSTFSSP